MRFTIRIAIAALSIGSIAPAFADSESGSQADIFMIAQRPTTQNDGQAVQTYATQASRGTWLHQPQDGGGANN